MALRTRSHDRQLTKLMEGSEALSRGRAWGSRKVEANFNNEDNHLQGRNENTRSEAEQMIDFIEQAHAKWDREHPNLELKSSEKACREEDNLASRAAAHRIVENMMQEATKKLDNWVINVPEQEVVKAL